MWDHRRLKVYAKALDAASALHALAERLPEGMGDMRDQLRRAASSIVLNIAEGGSEYSLGDKARFFRIARRSCAECSAVLDLAERVGCPPKGADAAQALLLEVAAMLSALISRPPPRPR